MGCLGMGAGSRASVRRGQSCPKPTTAGSGMQSAAEPVSSAAGASVETCWGEGRKCWKKRAREKK